MTVVLILAGADGGLADGSGCGGDEKWSDSGAIVEVEPGDVADGLHMGLR